MALSRLLSKNGEVKNRHTVATQVTTPQCERLHGRDGPAVDFGQRERTARSKPATLADIRAALPRRLSGTNLGLSQLWRTY